MTDPVYAYDKSRNDFRLFVTKEEWEGNIDVRGAISYLRNHLQKSLKDDFFPAYEAFKVKGVGFFALPRIVFPYITFLGTLYGGKDSSKNAVDYMNKYLSKVNQKYSNKELCDFIYRVYRHGLAHTNMPKVVSEEGKVYGWRLEFDENQHLMVDKTPNIYGKSAILSISPKNLANEVISSIDEYINDLQIGLASFDNFKMGFLSMATTSHYIDESRAVRIKIPKCLKE